jgi:hypothetical protein
LLIVLLRQIKPELVLETGAATAAYADAEKMILRYFKFSTQAFELL